jgi:predicted homoserine dehydrogenase-like protein
MGGLPLGLAHGVTLRRAIAKGQSLGFDDVSIDTTTRAYTVRREMERQFAAAVSPAAQQRREAAAVR